MGMHTLHGEIEPSVSLLEILKITILFTIDSLLPRTNCLTITLFRLHTTVKWNNGGIGRDFEVAESKYPPKLKNMRRQYKPSQPYSVRGNEHKDNIGTR